LTLKPSNGNGKVSNLEKVVSSLEQENSIFKTRIGLLQKSGEEQQKEIEDLKSTFEPENLRRLFEQVLDDYTKEHQRKRIQI
jgi:hypothetical protein